MQHIVLRVKRKTFSLGQIKISDIPAYTEVEPFAQKFIDQFTCGEIDALYIGYMNFISTGSQKPEVMTLLPGDVISTGTPGAVEVRPGDVAECRIGGFETLVNPVRR